MNAGPVTAEEIDAAVEGDPERPWFNPEITDRVCGHEQDVTRTEERRRLASRARARAQTLHPETLATLLERGTL